jgi:probable HAF family extracellular repeat protein
MQIELRFARMLSVLVLLLGLATAQPARAQNPLYTVTDLGTFGGTRTVAFSINKSGQVAGFAETGDGRAQAFVYTDGTLFNLGTLGGSDSYAYRISDSGFVVGRSQNAAGRFRAFVTLLNSSMFDISSLDSRLGGSFSFATAVNGLGQVVGYFQTPGPHMAARNRVFLYSGRLAARTVSLWQSTIQGRWPGALARTRGPTMQSESPFSTAAVT